MKFNFKIQQYQTDAVDAVVRVFQGQGFHDKISYIRDRGKVKAEPYQLTLGMSDEELEVIDPLNDTGYKNEAVELSDEQLLHNIQTLQSQNNIKLSASLVKDLGRCSLDIEMETGTGKTYVYIKTMFELNKKYGWSKFIVVVPSIAIVMQKGSLSAHGARRMFPPTICPFRPRSFGCKLMMAVSAEILLVTI